LGEDEIVRTKQAINWPLEPAFYVPEDSLDHFRRAVNDGKEAEAKWEERFAKYREAYPDLAKEWDMVMSDQLPEGWDEDLPTFAPADGKIAARTASGDTLQVLAARLPALLGGSADLSPSNSTALKGYDDLSGDNFAGRNIHYGVREHAMGSIMNGLVLHGGIIPYGATFLTFADYMRPPMRLAALMKLPVIYVFTHDSIAVGEDGPTHQPVGQLCSLRVIPNMTVIRPADANETVMAWKAAIEHKTGPVCLVLSRQGLPTLDQQALASAEGLLKGAYVLADTAGRTPDIILMGTGSELLHCLVAREQLAERGIDARVVSVPSFEFFEAQSQEYRDEVLPPSVTARLAIEAGATACWFRYVGLDGDIIGIDHFGASAPGDIVMEKVGVTSDHVVQRALALLDR
jgi:transketolase